MPASPAEPDIPMRALILALLLSLAGTGCRGNREGSQPPAGNRPTLTLEPAPTPGEACVRGEPRLGNRRRTRLSTDRRVPAAQRAGGAQLRSRFAALRLHRAVQAHGVTGRRSRDAGFDRSADLLVRGPTDPKDIEKAVAFFRDLEWTVDGDVATPATTRPVFGPDHRTRRPAPGRRLGRRPFQPGCGP